MRDFRRSLPMSLLKAREAVMKKFTPHLRKHDLSPQQWRVLRALYDSRENGINDVELSNLADQCFLLMPSLSRIIQYLEKRKLIKRRSSELDQRRSMVNISESGIELVEAMAPQSEARYEHITRVFGYGKLELLYELLDELTEKLTEADFQELQNEINSKKSSSKKSNHDTTAKTND